MGNTACGFQKSSAGIGQSLTVLINSISASAMLKQADSSPFIFIILRIKCTKADKLLLNAS